MRGTKDKPIKTLRPKHIRGLSNTEIYYKKISASWTYELAVYCLDRGIRLMQVAEQERVRWG